MFAIVRYRYKFTRLLFARLLRVSVIVRHSNVTFVQNADSLAVFQSKARRISCLTDWTDDRWMAGLAVPGLYSSGETTGLGSVPGYLATTTGHLSPCSK